MKAKKLETIREGDTLEIRGLKFTVHQIKGNFVRLYWTDARTNIVHIRGVSLETLRSFIFNVEGA